MTQVWSCGGGTQSAAIAALVVRGDLPKPDVAIIVDTEREKSGTWAYADGVLIPELAKVGVELVRIPKSKFATVDLYGHNGDLLLPVYTTQSGSNSKMPTFCSAEWKREVVSRYLRRELGVEECENWIGISLDEMSRVRTPRNAWMKLRYPLIFDVPMRRSECYSLVESMGWPNPPRSSCWMCPNMAQAEWVDMKENWPADFQMAVELEREIRSKDPHAYFHKSCVPLDQVDFTNNQTSFFDNSCSSGYCFI